MNYTEWNSHVANYFFRPENAGKDVLFYLTKQDLIEHARLRFTGSSDEAIWDDFIRAIKQLEIPPNNIKAVFPIDGPLQQYSRWNKKDTPPFIAYLILYIIPLTETYDEHFNATNYYGKVNVFFKKYRILGEDQSIGTGNFQTISHLWDELEEWTVITNDCDLGIFELRTFGNQNWIYVGKPFSQCILSPKAISKLPELFFEAGLIPESSYTTIEFRKIILQYGADTLGLTHRVLELVKSNSNELGHTILEIARREYIKWTGETHQDDVNSNDERPRRYYTVAPLFLQFKVNDNDGLINFSYRLYSKNEYPEDLKLASFENLYEANGWSRTLDISYKESFELSDDFNKWVARFPERDVRLFVNAGTFQLSAGYWIETESLSKTAPMFLLCKNSVRQSITEWGKNFRDGKFREADLDGLPEGYSLFRILNPTVSHSALPILTLFNEKKIQLTGGLKVNFRTFISDFFPEVEIVNSDGNEKVFLQYRNSEERIQLEKKKTSANRWLLPHDTLLDVDFDIKTQTDTLRSETAYILVGTKDAAIKVDGIQLFKRDPFGMRIDLMPGLHCSGNNIVPPTKASQRYFCAWGSLFLPLNEESLSQITAAHEQHNFGNNLCNYLSVKNVVTTEEFYRAFEFYYAKEFSTKQINGDFNLTRIKKIALNYYDYLGIVDYEYETKKIITNPPQLIFIPSEKGRKVLLVGGRDTGLVDSIIAVAPKYDLQVEIEHQFPSNQNLLLPNAITIKAFGSSANAYGERSLLSFANEIKLPLRNDYFVQIALELFSADLSEYEKYLVTNNEISPEDYGWARRIFSPDSLNYERDESVSFDKTFSLIEYKLNEYTYFNKLWKDGKCYRIDKNWGRYLALKHFKRDVILVDDVRKKVAIPLETPLPKLLAKSVMLLSGLAPNFTEIEGRYYRIYENIPGVFTQNLFKKLGQKPLNKILA